MSLVSPTISAIEPYQAGKPIEEVARELGILDAVKLASNENALGPSPKAVEAVARSLSELHRYPDAASFVLRNKLADHVKVDPAEILTGNGSNEILELVVRTFATSAHHIVFAEPSFVVYRLVALAHGVPFTAVPLSHATHDLRAMATAVTPNTRVLFVTNPNNPTGTYVTERDLADFLRALPEEVIVVVDEAYIEYADASDFPDALGMRALHERLVITRTFSKIYGLAGLRVGYAVAPRNLVDYMNRVRAPFNVSIPGQVAATAALDDREHVERTRRTNREQRDRLTRALGELGLTVVPSQANFLCVDMHRPAQPLYEALLRRGVIVRPIGPLPDALRLTIGLPEENTRLLLALREVLAT